MQPSPPDIHPASPALPVDTREVLGKAIVLNLEHFPELHWLCDYFTALHTLQLEHDRLSRAMQAIEQKGEAYSGHWIEPYTKTKNGKSYTYHQVRWLTGDYKKSGQPKVKTKHLSRQQLGEVQAAIARGHQVKALQAQQHDIDAHITRLKEQVHQIGQHLECTLSRIV
jgi:hypothetical protein